MVLNRSVCSFVCSTQATKISHSCDKSYRNVNGFNSSYTTSSLLYIFRCESSSVSYNWDVDIRVFVVISFLNGCRLSFRRVWQKQKFLKRNDINVITAVVNKLAALKSVHQSVSNNWYRAYHKAYSILYTTYSIV